ncbi:MAG: molybdopterin molybdotransferase MoeA [Bacteroidales bacterium]|nr:molybdopterin molybdotransferase MoeA [Bacteroidales bacterium]
MIPYEEAYDLIINSTCRLGLETIDFQESLHRILAEDIISDLEMPPFNKAAMDGYACRKEDLQNTLEVIEIIPAGYSPKKEVGENQCAKIMTGAPVPVGADTVIMIEYTKNIDDNHIRFTRSDSKSNICLVGEDVKKGEVLLKKGTSIKAKHIPVLAMVGAVLVSVYKQPKVTVVSTGNELVEPHIKPNSSQIRNSNAYQMIAQLAEMKLPVQYLGIAKDTKEDTEVMLHKAMKESDTIIMSGAVSMGDYDFVPEVLKESGFKIHFHGVATKPGKKTIFATKDSKWFVGVPGNPVSAFVQFELLIKPLLMGIMGKKYKPKFYPFVLQESFHRKHTERKSFEPIIINPDNTVRLIEYHGSAHINALSYADGLMVVEKGVSEIKVGEKVDVRLI